MGEIQWVGVDDGAVVVTMLASSDFGDMFGETSVDYPSFESCLKKIYAGCASLDEANLPVIHFPLMKSIPSGDCGNACKSLIADMLWDMDVVIYD